MLNLDGGYEKFLEKFTKWAKSRKDIKTAIVVGSRARLEHPADTWSDLDILIFTTKPKDYILNEDWIGKCGRVITRTSGHTVGNDPEWQVTFDGGIDVDFVFNSYNPINIGLKLIYIFDKIPFIYKMLPKKLLKNLEYSIETGSQTFNRGMHIIFDKKNFTKLITKVLNKKAICIKPTFEEFYGLTQRYWSCIERVSKKVCRGELYVAINNLNYINEDILFRMINWYMNSINNWSYDTWHAGRFFEEWVDKSVLLKMESIFPRYVKDDIINSITSSMDLFDKLSIEVAKNMKFDYSADSKENIKKLVNKYFNQVAQ